MYLKAFLRRKQPTTFKASSSVCWIRQTAELRDPFILRSSFDFKNKQQFHKTSQHFRTISKQIQPFHKKNSDLPGFLQAHSVSLQSVPPAANASTDGPSARSNARASAAAGLPLGQLIDSTTQRFRFCLGLLAKKEVTGAKQPLGRANLGGYLRVQYRIVNIDQSAKKRRETGCLVSPWEINLHCLSHAASSLKRRGSPQILRSSQVGLLWERCETTSILIA